MSCVINNKTRKFHYGDLIWRSVPRRKREKQQDTFTGPHRILRQIGNFSYEVTSAQKTGKLLKLNINDVKVPRIPDTR
jgi:hypothetical protein